MARNTEAVENGLTIVKTPENAATKNAIRVPKPIVAPPEESFYILNPGYSTVKPLVLAAKELSEELGVEMRYTDIQI
jgi:hypothetical protein